MSGNLRIFGFAGSLRQDSYNKALLRAAGEVLPAGVELTIFDLAGIPPFNADLVLQPSPQVREFKTGIKTADALLIATPEYNYSMPGVLENAIDWASRPHGDNSFDDKPVAIMGASTGMLGTARAQYHLRQSCVYLNMHPLNKPEVMVPFAQDRIDGDGKLIDAKTRDKIKEMVESLVVWTRRLTNST